MSDAGETLLPLPPNARQRPTGLGGLLLLPFVHLGYDFIATIYGLFGELRNYNGLIAIVSGGSERLEALQWPLALASLGALLVIGLAPAGIYAMLVRSRHAPTVMIGYYLGACIAAGLKALSNKMVAAILKKSSDVSPAADLPAITFWLFVWAIYFLRSRRVRNTFRPARPAPGETVAETFA